MTESTPPVEAFRSRSTVDARLSEARSAGRWLPWLAGALALLWWGGAAAASITLYGVDGLQTLATPVLALGVIGAVLPGALILMAGFMARETTRAASANALILEAGTSLLRPADNVATEAKTFADEMSASAAQVDKTVGHALSAMKAMAGEIGDERLRLESVSYAAADNARDLAERLGKERAAMELLARELKAQTDGMSEAIPRQAALMAEAARKAGEEFAEVDEALERRLQALDDAGNTLGAKLVDLDTMTRESGRRVEEVSFAIGRLEEKLDQSRKTVEQAARSGEMAAAAAGTTGDALKDAVSASLDGARTATAEIQAKTRQASEEMARALAELREQSEQTVKTLKATGMAARAETDIAEKRLNSMSDSIARATSATVLELSKPVSNGAEAPAPVAAPPPHPTPDPAPAVTRAEDDELFDAETEAELMRPALRERSDVEMNGGSLPVRSDNGSADQPPVIRKGREESTEWSDILADMDREVSPPELGGAGDREENAETLINRLQISGIRLPDAFKPKDKRRIAAAARKGDQQRRSATKTAAGRQVERVAKRLEADHALRSLAEAFVSTEQTDALTALEQTSKTGRNASPRLSAFLLLDAAIEHRV